jgi:nitroreductase
MNVLTSNVLSLLNARYDAQHPEVALACNAVIASMLGHRSVRAYLDQPLPAGTLEALVASAQSAASSSNLHAWSVVAVTDPQRKARLAEYAGNQAHVRQAPLFLVWLADLARLRHVSEDQALPGAALDTLEMFLVAVIDAALAAQNAVVAAESMGLGTVYIGAMRNQPEQVAQELGLPPGVFAAFGLCVGWPDPEKPAQVKPRLMQHTVLHHEQYNLAAQADPIARYDESMTRFYRANGMKATGWKRHSAQRVAHPEALNGRDRLRTALQALGFELK